MEKQDEKQSSGPICQSEKVKKDGVRKTLLYDKQRWFCKACGKRWFNSPIRNIKGNPKTIITEINGNGIIYKKRFVLVNK
jgi:transposase-like protein